MQKPSPQSLQTKLGLLILLVFVPILGLALYSDWRQREHGKWEAEQNILGLVRQAITTQRHLADGADDLLTALARLPEVKNRDAAKCNALFAAMLRHANIYTNLIAVDTAGKLFCSASPSSAVDYYDRAWLRQAVETRKLFAGEYMIGRNTGKPSFGIAYPMLDDKGNVQAVVGAGLAFDWLEELLKNARLPEGSTVTVIDSKGVILTRYPDPKKWVGKTPTNEPVIRTILDQHEGTTETTGLDGIRRFYSFGRLPGSPAAGYAYVAFGIPTEAVFADANREFLRGIIGTGIIGLLTLVTVWIVADRSVLRPVNRLVGVAKRLGAGDLNARSGLPQGTAELNQLSKTFDDMATALQMRQAEAKRAEEKIRNLAKFPEENPSPVLRVNHDGQILEANSASSPLLQVWGCQATGFLPQFWREVVSDSLGSGTRKLIDAVCREQIFSLSVVPVRDSGYVNLYGTDVTERRRDEQARKKAEEQLKRNLQELSALREIDKAIVSELDVHAVLQTLLDKVDLLLPYSAVTIRLFNRENGLLEPVACRNLDEKEWKAEQWRGGRGTPNVVFESGIPLVVSNVQNDPRVRDPEFFAKHGLVSYLGTPLIVKEHVLGVLSFYTKEGHEFSDEEVEFLETLAGQAAIAIHNAQLFNEVVQANKVKDEFLSVMSHELRTPLNVVMGYGGMMRDGMMGEINPTQDEALRKILTRSGDLLSMINDVLQATQLESRAVVAERQLLVLPEFLDHLASSYSLSLDKEVTLVWNYLPDLPPLITDSAKLKQILQNLIDNAIKFTEKGSVTISANIRYEATGERQQEEGLLAPHPSRLSPHAFVEFKVADTGIGIPKEDLPYIFEKFHQVDSSETRRYGGVGIGLYIVKKFTELLGGMVEVESELGKGSTFTVTVPYGQ